jgi:hypothetical protein
MFAFTTRLEAIGGGPAHAGETETTPTTEPAKAVL